MVAHLEVDVRTGRPAGGAHSGHRLALGDRVARLHQQLGAVGVVGLEAARVGEDHQVAISASLSGEGNHAVSGGVDGGAGGGGDVDAPVEVGLTKDEAVAVIRGDGPPNGPQEETAIGKLGLGLGAGAHDEGNGFGEGDGVQVGTGDGHAASLDHPGQDLVFAGLALLDDPLFPGEHGGVGLGLQLGGGGPGEGLLFDGGDHQQGAGLLHGEQETFLQRGAELVGHDLCQVGRVHLFGDVGHTDGQSLGGEVHFGVQFLEPLLGHVEPGHEALQGVPGLNGVGEGSGGLGQEQVGQLPGSGHPLLCGQVFIPQIYLAVKSDRQGLRGGVVVGDQGESLLDDFCTLGSAHQDAVHRDGVHVLQLRDDLHDGVGGLGELLHLVLGGQGGADGDIFCECVVGGQDAGGLGLGLGHGGRVGLLALDISDRLALGVHRVAQGAGGGQHRAGEDHSRQPQKGQAGFNRMGSAPFLALAAEGLKAADEV